MVVQVEQWQNQTDEGAAMTTLISHLCCFPLLKPNREEGEKVGRKPTSTKILFNSISAIGLPRQVHLPEAKTRSTVRSINLSRSSSASSQRSGRKTSTSSP